MANKPSSFVTVAASEEDRTYFARYFRVVRNPRTNKTYTEAIAFSGGHRTQRDARLAVIRVALAAAGETRPLTHRPFASFFALQRRAA